MESQAIGERLAALHGKVEVGEVASKAIETRLMDIEGQRVEVEAQLLKERLRTEELDDRSGERGPGEGTPRGTWTLLKQVLEEGDSFTQPRVTIERAYRLVERTDGGNGLWRCLLFYRLPV